MSTARDEKEDKAMTNNDVRRAHELLDRLDSHTVLSKEQEKLLRSFLPELPKQKTLEELAARVYDAWMRTSGYEWAGNIDTPDISLEKWLADLHQQLRGLKNAPAAAPELPAGMRLADHEVYGRVVVSPKSDANGVCEILYADSNAEIGATYDYAHQCELAFVDAESSKTAHPEFLETEADYQKAPEGTIVALDGSGTIWLKKFGGWRNTAGDHGVESACIALDSRRVLRWGWGK